MKPATHFTDGERIALDDSGMIRLLEQAEGNIAKLEPGEAIPFDIGQIEFLTEQTCIDIGRARMLNLIAQREIELIDEREAKRNVS